VADSGALLAGKMAQKTVGKIVVSVVDFMGSPRSKLWEAVVTLT
jgi:hypothetical protein